MKFAVVIFVILATASAGCSKLKHPVTQCRVEVGLPIGPLGQMVDGDWTDCQTAEHVADKVYEVLKVPGAGVWTEEQTQIDKKHWTAPKKHTEVRVTPNDFTQEWDSL
jgi:hypothetical protein